MSQAKENVLTEFLSQEEILQKVDELASRLNSDFNGKNPIFIGVLNGAFIFLSDLIRRIDIDCEIDFLKLSSYGDEKISSGDVTILKELNCDPAGRNLIIVEDIVDTGGSINFIKELLEKNNPESVNIVTLLYKKEKCHLDYEIGYPGFLVEDKFYVGYGMDYSQKYRNLKDIYVL